MKHLRQLISLLLTLVLCCQAVGGLAESTSSFDEAALNAYLKQLAEGTKDPWQQAVYQAGAENLTEENGVLTFFLRDFSPEVKTLPKQKDDPAGWLEGFFANVAAYRMEASLTLENGAPTKKSENKLKADVQKAANKAKAAFNQQDVRNGLLDLFFPEPYKDQAALNQNITSDAFQRWWSRHGMEEGDQQAWAARLYAQSGRQLNVAQGPHALEISVKLADVETLLSQASSAMLSEVSRIARANAMDEEELMRRFTKALSEQAAKLRRGKQTKQVFQGDIDVLAAGGSFSDYQAFFFDYGYRSAFGDLLAQVRAMPDYPAQDYPKNGRLSGATSGTKVIIKSPRDEMARYIQIRSAADDGLLVSLFLRPGGTATVRVPQGNAYMLIAAGITWYGEEGLFAADSRYSKTDEFEVLSARYYHTISLQPVADGPIRLWDVDADAFRQQ